MRIVGWTPLKHDSERFPDKNRQLLDGKPLFCHMVETMLRCDMLDDVYINTDSQYIARHAQTEFHGCVKVVERKPEHQSPTMSTVEMVIDDLTEMAADVVVITHCTVPLLKVETLTEGILAYINNAPRYDSVVSVTRMHERLYDEMGRAMNFHSGIILPLQDLPPVFVENNAFFIIGTETAMQLRNRVGQRPLLFEVEPDEAVDIDYELDLRWAQFLLDERKRNAA